MIEKKCKDSSTEHSEDISDEEKVVEVFSNFFVSNLKIPTNHNCNMDFQKTDDPMLNPINKKYHSSIVLIKSKIEPESIFHLHQRNMKIFLEKLKI